MKFSDLLLLLAATASTAQASDKSARPRGVGPECKYLDPDYISTSRTAGDVTERSTISSCFFHLNHRTNKGSFSCEILPGLADIYLYLEPFGPNSLLGRQ
jgi:hypothetical protein